MVEPLALMNGMRVEAVTWPEALDDPARLIEGRPAVVYVCRPNNPTGTSAPAAWLDRLLDAARAEPAPRPLVVLDEAYADFASETRAPTAPEHPCLLVARTASKAYGLAGLRCGWGVASPEVTLEIEKSRGPYKVARLAAEAAAAAVRDEGGWMVDTVAACRDARTRLHGELERRGIEAPASDANFLLIPAPSGVARDDAIALRALGVAVRPFAGIPDIGEGLRVTVGPWSMMERFLGALDRLLASGAELAR
jgi:histidinol-phosphate/aromatic aminotransferase/cobyric acid decarboxylase-like protein